MRPDENELIGIIYETTLNPGLWPLVLDGLTSLLNDHTVSAIEPRLPDEDNFRLDHSPIRNTSTLLQNDKIHGKQINGASGLPGDSENHRLFENLKPHLRRALQLRLNQQKIEQKYHTVSRLLDNVPIGILVVDVSGRVLFANSMAEKMVDGRDGLTQSGEYIHPLDDTAKEIFHKHLIDICSDAARHPISMHLDCKDNEKISILISRFDYLNEIIMTTFPAAMIFSTPPAHRRELSYPLLKSMFGLSRSEAILSNALIHGKSLEDIAHERSVSIYTIRNQISSLFSKTGTRRQSELICQLLTCSASFPFNDKEIQHTEKKTKPKRPSQKYKINRFRLADSRFMGYAEYGDPNGKPVVFCHSVYGCRFEKPANENILNECNIRVIIPDRPGVGLSDFNYFSSYLDWTPDLEQLADHLELDSFFVSGYGVGGNFALAAAWKLPARINNVLVISPTMPVPYFKNLKHMTSSYKMILGLTQRLPSLGAQILNAVYKGAEKNLDRFLTEILPADELECRVFMKPEIRAVYQLSLPEITKHGIRGMPQEVRLLVKDWDFNLEKITQPVCFWRGELDGHTPKLLAEEFMSIVPHATVHRVANQGYTLFYTDWENIIRYIADA